MLKTAINLISVWMIPAIILIVLIWGLVKKVPVYEVFVDGAKDGLRVSMNILPYLVAIIVAVSMLRASGAIELVQGAFSGIFEMLKIPADILPVMVVRSLSGSAVLGLLSDIVHNFGPDSYPAKLAAVMVGSSEIFWLCGDKKVQTCASDGDSGGLRGDNCGNSRFKMAVFVK